MRGKGPDPDRNLYVRDGIYWCRWLVGGVERRQTLRTADVRRARTERDKILAGASEVRAGRAPAVAPLVEAPRRWEEAVGAWATHQDGMVRRGALAAATAARYECSVRMLSGVLEGFPLKEITGATVLDYVRARQDEGRASSTIGNDLTAWSRVASYALQAGWVSDNPARAFDRRAFLGQDADALDPPSDREVSDLAEEVRSWSLPVALLITWLRETGMRLAEALHLRAEDVHPGGAHATLKLGVKRNRRSGSKSRTIKLGRASELLRHLPAEGRLVAALPLDSATVSTRYGQWRRQRQGREDRAAEADRRASETLRTWRLHDLRHAYAMASLIDDPQCIYRLRIHLGHSTVTTTEGYTRFLAGEGAQRRYGRRPDLYGSLPPEERVPPGRKRA